MGVAAEGESVLGGQGRLVVLGQPVVDLAQTQEYRGGLVSGRRVGGAVCLGRRLQAVLPRQGLRPPEQLVKGLPPQLGGAEQGEGHGDTGRTQQPMPPRGPGSGHGVSPPVGFTRDL